MKEDFLHYLWKFQKFPKNRLRSSHGEEIRIYKPGIHNTQAGPDFLNASMKIGSQLWAGNVEIHIRSSDWYAHNHETDSNYDAVILHVVWEHDVEVYGKHGLAVPTLTLKNLTSSDMLDGYSRLMSGMHRWIPCEDRIGEVDTLQMESWLMRLYIERLERKAVDIQTELRASNNHWEATLFKLLARSFGSGINGESFTSMATSFDFTIVQKLNEPFDLEALFMGQSGMLESEIEDGYYRSLQERYSYLKRKYTLRNESVEAPSFFRLRPTNFPTIRLSQLAQLYARSDGLFSKLMHAGDIDELFALLYVKAGPYWSGHYNFGVSSWNSMRSLSGPFKELVIINAILPLRFCYAGYLGRDDSDSIISIISSIPSEKNSIVNKFRAVCEAPGNAMVSQAFIQLKKEYCEHRKCLQCAVGNHLLKQ